MNGGIKTVEDTKHHLQTLDGVMIGREAYQNPRILADIEHKIFDHHDTMDMESVARAMIPYIEQQQAEHGTPVKSITRHMVNLFHSQPGGRAWRRALSTLPHEDGADASVIEEALILREETANHRKAA